MSNCERQKAPDTASRKIIGIMHPGKYTGAARPEPEKHRGNVMMSEELQLTPPEKSMAFNSAIIVGISALVGSLIPLFPFFFWAVAPSIWISIVIAALTLFVVGVYKARVTVGRPFRSGMQMAVIGTVSALAGYGVGLIFRVPAVP